jgi:peptidoglycan/xylan/chitin deacetylase (PgdA/CDA1 family)
MAEKKKKRLKIAILASLLLLVTSFCFYRFILYPKHFAEFAFWNEQPKALPFFMFHENDSAELEELLSFLKKNNYKTLSLNEAKDMVQGKTTYSGREVVLTFDDGKLALWTITAPKLKEYGFKGIAFVNPGLVEEGVKRPQHQGKTSSDDLKRYCNWQELEALKAHGIEIQSHSDKHSDAVFKDPLQHGIQKEKMHESLSHSRDVLTEKKFGPQVFFCAPFGSVSVDLIKVAKDCQYSHVIGVSAFNQEEFFYALENDFSKNSFIYRFNFRCILSLPGEGRESVLGRIWRRISKGGDRGY